MFGRTAFVLGLVALLAAGCSEKGGDTKGGDATKDRGEDKGRDREPPESDAAKRIKSPSASVRAKAAADLGAEIKNPDKAATLLCELLAAEGDKNVIQAATAALRDVRPDLQPHVSALLVQRPRDRAEPLRALSEMRSGAAPTKPILVAFIRAAMEGGPAFEGGVKSPVADLYDAILAVCPDDPSLFVFLLDSARPENWKSNSGRLDAARAVVRYAKEHKEAREDAARGVLVTLGAISPQSFEADYVRCSLIGLLKDLGPSARPTLSELKRFLADERPAVQKAASEAVEAIEGR